MHNRSIVFGFIAIICFQGFFCKSTSQKNVSSKDSLSIKIKELETQLFKTASSNPISNSKAMEVIDCYEKYIKANPKDSLTPIYLMRAADICSNISQAQKSVGFCDSLIRNFPNNAKVPDAMFLMAFITENKLGNQALAKELYQKFIDKYPNHPLANDAKACIENLGMSDEEIIAKFEKQNASTKK